MTSLNQGSPDGALSAPAAADEAFAHVLTSVLLDGELRGEEFAQACLALESDAQARQRWHDYHLVGEALRQGAGEVCWVLNPGRTHDELFLSRLRGHLAQENTPRGWAEERIEHPSGQRLQDQRRAVRQGANDSYGAWRITAGLCALVVVGMLGWQGVAGLQSASQVRQLAQARADQRSSTPAEVGRWAMPQRVSATASTTPMFTASDGVAQSFLAPRSLGQDAPMVMLRDPRLDHLMARQGGVSGRVASEGRYPRPRLGRPGVAAQGVLVNLDKSPVLPR
ncbi:sigma-E factor negative regulatory protein [Hylemonella gracilis]|uniref:sigma-E factor negative regulatory protein n=1 Tax=Hylemonella gracilis TaxID=80880 RepID=UPI0013F15E2B|nr:sigma-E factor negative regulatory protein [Hylemonella gracilis]